MARSFTKATPHYLEVDVAAVLVYPFTMACWFRMNDVTQQHTLMWIGDKDVVDHFCCLQARGDVVGDPLRAFHHTYGGPNPATWADTIAGYTANTWHHISGVFRNATYRYVLLDGGNFGSDNAPITAPHEHDRTGIGGARDSTPGSYTDGTIAEIAMWDVELNFTERLALARGVSPRYIRPGNLKLYVPLWGNSDPEYDLSNNGINLAVTGATKAVDHAPVRLFTPPWAATLLYTPSAAPQELTPTAATLTLVAVDPVVSLGAITMTPTAAATPIVAADPVIALGTLTLTPTPATMPLVIADPTVGLSLALTPTTATVSLAVPDPTVTLGTLTLTPTSATTTLVAPSPALVMSLAITPTPAATQISVPDPVLALSLNLTPTAAVTAIVAANPSVALGVLTLTPTPAALPLVAPSPTLALSLALSPTAVAVNLAIASPVLALLLTLLPTPATTPIVVPNPLLIIPGVAAPYLPFAPRRRGGGIPGRPSGSSVTRSSGSGFGRG